MPVAWLVCGYRRQTGGRPTIRRVPAFDGYMEQIQADGGNAAWTEILGQRCIAKIRAATGTLAAIAAEPDVTRIPAAALDSPLSSLTTQQRAALRQLAIDCGYTTADWAAAFPNGISGVTLREVLIFLARRRRRVRYDEATDTILDDGPDEPVTPVGVVDLTVS